MYGATRPARNLLRRVSFACFRRTGSVCWLPGRFFTKPMPSPPTNAGHVIEADVNRSQEGANHLLPQLYDELRALAAMHLRQERPDHTLQPTALVHEAYVKLIDQAHAGWQSKSHFMALAAQFMRRILIDHARARNADKRGGSRPRSMLTDTLAGALDCPIDLLDLDAALEQLASIDPRRAQVVEMRFFGGMDVPAAAEALGVSERTVKSDWRFARAWLSERLSGECRLPPPEPESA